MDSFDGEEIKGVIKEVIKKEVLIGLEMVEVIMVVIKGVIMEDGADLEVVV